MRRIYHPRISDSEGTLPVIHGGLGSRDIDKAAQNIVDYMLALDSELKKLMAPIGNSSLPVGRSDALVTTDRAIAEKLAIQYVC